jgi:hypothetical protein
MRGFNAALRRSVVASLVRKAGLGYGAQSRIARRLGVNRSTISRDIAAIREFCAFDWTACGDWLPDGD